MPSMHVDRAADLRRHEHRCRPTMPPPKRRRSRRRAIRPAGRRGRATAAPTLRVDQGLGKTAKKSGLRTGAGGRHSGEINARSVRRGQMPRGIEAMHCACARARQARRPSLSTMRTRSAAFLAPSFSMMRARCTSMVRGEMPSSRPACLFDEPGGDLAEHVALARGQQIVPGKAFGSISPPAPCWRGAPRLRSLRARASRPRWRRTASR